MKQFYFVLLILALVVLLYQCESQTDPDAPELPPTESFLMDLEDFESNNAKSTLLDTISFQNWNYAAGQVVFWNFAVYITSAIPIAAFVESFNHKPEYLGDKKWEWAYVVVNSNTSYTARLTGEILDSDSVEWKMYISKDVPLPFADVLWYEGKSHIDRSGGWWILRRNAYAPEDFLKITWRRSSNTTGDLKYTNIIPGDPGNGGYINFSRVEEDADGFDSYYIIQGAAQNNSVKINWNHITKEGRVQKLNETEWSCWDGNLHDIVCP